MSRRSFDDMEDEELFEIVREKIRSFMTRQGMLANHVAHSTGIPKNSLSNILNAKVNLSIKQAIRLKRGLGLSLNYLYDPDEDDPMREGMAPPGPKLTAAQEKVLDWLDDLGMEEMTRRVMQTPAGPMKGIRARDANPADRRSKDDPHGQDVAAAQDRPHQP